MQDTEVTAEMCSSLEVLRLLSIVRQLRSVRQFCVLHHKPYKT